MKERFANVMTPYAERCQDALEPYREGVRAQRIAQHFARLADAHAHAPQLLSGEGSMQNSEIRSRLKQSLR